MKLFKMMAEMTQYFSEAFALIFSPSHDDYPAIGMQPYTGDPSDEVIWA